MKTLFTIGCFALLLCLNSCTVTLISEYDEYTDKAVSDMQEQVELHLTRMEKLAVGFDGQPVRPACEYQQNQEFYIESLAAARTLKTRNEVRPRNDITTRQLGLLIDNLENLEMLHQGDPPDPGHCLSSANTQLARASMDQMFNAILKLEDAKKRGESK